VPYEDFLAARERHCPDAPIYLSVQSGWTTATCGDPTTGFLLASVSRKLVKVVIEDLHAAGLEAFEGGWIGSGEVHLPDESADCYVAAVSYSGRTGPGIWVDAYAHMPTQVQVLRSMFDELCETGELEGMDFDSFIRLANPTVAIISPREIEGYLERNAAREL
jgi:hypothetical protein